MFQPAFYNLLAFMQAWKTASKLRDYLECMDVPTMRKDVLSIHNLQWLKRNIGINNCFHHMYDETVRLIDKMLMGDLVGIVMRGLDDS